MNLPSTPAEQHQPGEGFSAPVTIRVLGDFELRREIGRGGMGTVFEARQRSLNRLVAVKVLSPSVSASPTAVKRFQREAEAAANLKHLNITPILAQGYEHGVHYYAMELVDGPSLNAVLSRARSLSGKTALSGDPEETVLLPRRGSTESSGSTPPPGSSDSMVAESSSTTVHPSPATPGPEQTPLDPLAEQLAVQAAESSWVHFHLVARHVADVADALDYAHRCGVIHRDIKPHNLLIGRDGRIRITDFGLARLNEQPGVTMTGEMIGSPLYMSPEQISEDRDRVDHRTDVYSLGATLYEWLTLSPPYPAETRERVISLIAHSESLPLRSRNGAVPIALETICMKAIDRDSRRRFQTAGELRDDLQRFLADQPIRARRANAAARTGKWLLRHQIASLLGLAATITIVLSWSLWSKQQEIRTKTADLEQANAESEAIREDANQVLDALSVLGVPVPLEIGGPVRAAEAAIPFVQSLISGGPVSGSPRPATEPSAGNADAVRSTSTVPPLEPIATPVGLSQRALLELYEEIQSPTDLEVASGDDLAVLLDQARALRESDPTTAMARVDSYLAIPGRGQDLHALLLRSALYERLGDHRRMLADAETLTRLGGSNARIRLWMALGYLVTAKVDAARLHLDRAVALGAPKAWCELTKALSLLHAGFPQEADSYLTSAAQEAPDLAMAWLARAIVSAGLSFSIPDRDSAESALRKAIVDISKVIALEPNNSEALTLRGQLFGQVGEYANAARDFDLVMKLVGRTQPLYLQWMMAKIGQRKRDTGLRSHAPTPGNSSIPPPAPFTDSADVTQDHIQAWFSRFIYPEAGSRQDNNLDRRATTPRG